MQNAIKSNYGTQRKFCRNGNSKNFITSMKTANHKTVINIEENDIAKTVFNNDNSIYTQLRLTITYQER